MTHQPKKKAHLFSLPLLLPNHKMFKVITLSALAAASATSLEADHVTLFEQFKVTKFGEKLIFYYLFPPQPLSFMNRFIQKLSITSSQFD